MVYDRQSKSSSWTPTPRKSSFFPPAHIQTKTEAKKGSELVGNLPSKAQRDKIRRSLFGDIPEMTGAKAETAPTEAKEVQNPTQVSEEAASGEIQRKAETGLSQSQGYGVPSREVRNKIRRRMFGNLEPTPVQKQEEGTSPLTSILEGEGSQVEAGGEEKGLAETEISLPIQAKLTIGEPNDKYEQEADRVARQVVDKIHSPTPETVQREEMGDEDEVRLKSDAGSGEKVEAGVGVTGERNSPIEGVRINRKVNSEGETQEASADLEASIQGKRGSGQPLNESVREPMEREFGADFSGVRVHTDAKSDELNQAIQAKAFTTGEDIFFRGGAYEPGSKGGQELLAHELTHVVQQKGGGVQPQVEPIQLLNINHSLLQRQITTTKEGYTITVKNGLRFLPGFDSATEKLVLKHFMILLGNEHTRYHDLKNLKWDLRTKVDQALQAYSPVMLDFLAELDDNDNIDAHKLIYAHSREWKKSKSLTVIKFIFKLIFQKNIAPEDIPDIVTFANDIPSTFNTKEYLLSKYIYDFTRSINLSIKNITTLVQKCNGDKVKSAFLYDLAKGLPKILLTPEISAILNDAKKHKHHLNIIQSLTDEHKQVFFTANHVSIPKEFDLDDFNLLYQLNNFSICQNIDVTIKIKLVEFCSKNPVRKVHLISLCKSGKIPSLPTLELLGDLTASQDQEIVTNIIALIEDNAVDKSYLLSIRSLLQHKDFYEYTDKKVTEELNKQKTELGENLAEKEKEEKFNVLSQKNSKSKDAKKIQETELKSLYAGEKNTNIITKTKNKYQKLIKSVNKEFQEVEKQFQDKRTKNESEIDEKKAGEMQKYSQYIESVESQVESQSQDTEIIDYAINLVKTKNLDLIPAKILVKYAIQDLILTKTITPWAIHVYPEKYNDLDQLCANVFALEIKSLPMIKLLMDDFKDANDQLASNSTIHKYIVSKAAAATNVNVFYTEMEWYVLWFINNKQTDTNIDNILNTFKDLKERKALTTCFTNSRLRNQLVTYKQNKQPDLFGKIKNICEKGYSTLDELADFFDCIEKNYQSDFEKLCNLYLNKKGTYVVQSVLDAHNHNNAPTGFIEWLVTNANAVNVTQSVYFLGHENAYHEYLCSQYAANLVDSISVKLQQQKPTSTSGTSNDILQIFDVQITLKNNMIIKSEVHNHVLRKGKEKPCQTSLHFKNNNKKGRELMLKSDLGKRCQQATLDAPNEINTRFPQGYELS